MAPPQETRFKRPESVLVLVHTAAGEVLLLRRRQPIWFWQSVTGSLEPGESPVEAARRELYEETGLCAGARLIDCRHSETFPIIPPWRSRYAPEVRCNREHWFRLRLPARQAIHLDPAEHLEYRWLPRVQAAARVWSWTNRRAILKLGAG